MMITDPEQWMRERNYVAPKRIISLVPSQTELICDLGAADALVGVTKFCVHPPDIRKKAGVIGGTKNLRMEAIRKLAPDLIIANHEENVKEQVEALAEDFPVWVSDVRDVDGALEMIRCVGILLGSPLGTAGLIADITAAFDRLELLVRDSKDISTLYCIWKSPWMSVGADTFIHDVMQRAGLQNVCGDRLRYPELSEADIRRLRPELILLSSEPYPFTGKQVSEMAEIAPWANVQLVDGEYFSWYGSRLKAAVNYLLNFRKSLL